MPPFNGRGTGDASSYKDDEEKIFDAQRPILLNGIGDVAVNGDLLSRMVILSLPEIDGKARKEDVVLWREFDAAKPQILGTLFNGVSAALRNRETVNLETKPRMADFAIWASAAECELALKRGSSSSPTMKTGREANDVALESSPVAIQVYEFMRNKDSWEGTFGELNRKANIQLNSPRALSNALARVKPSLRSVGITFQRLPRQPGDVSSDWKRGPLHRQYRHYRHWLNAISKLRVTEG